MIEPPVPVTVTVVVPSAACAVAVKVSVELPLPGAGIGLGLNEAVTPAGRPVALRLMAELKPPEIVVVMVEVFEPPCATDTELGFAEIVKSGAVTVRLTVVLCDVPPPVPVMVIG